MHRCTDVLLNYRLSPGWIHRSCCLIHRCTASAKPIQPDFFAGEVGWNQYGSAREMFTVIDLSADFLVWLLLVSTFSFAICTFISYENVWWIAYECHLRLLVFKSVLRKWAWHLFQVKSFNLLVIKIEVHFFVHSDLNLMIRFIWVMFHSWMPLAHTQLRYVEIPDRTQPAGPAPSLGT